MDLPTILMLIAAGVAGGVMAGVAGGASLVTFPALIAAGLPPIVAVASNTAALTPSNLVAGLADFRKFPRFNRALAGLILSSLLGGIIGAGLLLITPNRVFEILVPLLLGFATLLLAYSSRITEWLRARAVSRGKHENAVPIGFPVLMVSIYGGYFGAGYGVLLLGVMALATAGEYRSANATKNLLATFNTIVAGLVFAVQGALHWPATLVMMAGAVAGGLLGGYLARVLPRSLMQVVIVSVGSLLTVVYAIRYWF